MLGWMRMKKNRFLGPWRQDKLMKTTGVCTVGNIIYIYRIIVVVGWVEGKRKRWKWIRKWALKTEDWKCVSTRYTGVHYPRVCFSFLVRSQFFYACNSSLDSYVVLNWIYFRMYRMTCYLKLKLVTDCVIPGDN